MNDGVLIHSKLNNLRAISRLINSELFISVLAAASPEKADEVKTYISTDNLIALKSWLKINNTDPENMSMRQLRLKARFLGVKNYSHLTKAQLVDAINANSQTNS